MEFSPGSVHKATATFSNPKTAGFDYKATIHMGTGWTEMASASFHLNAGQSKAVEFSVTMPATPGEYPVYFKVTSGGVLIGTFVAAKNVVIAAVLMLSFSNPQRSSVVAWASAARNLVPTTAPWFSSPLVELGQKARFPEIGRDFLLQVHEYSLMSWQSAWLGPYVVNVPAVGGYTWDSLNESINGVRCKNLSRIPNASRVTGPFQKWTRQVSGIPVGDDNLRDILSLILETSKQGEFDGQSGEDIGSYFLGNNIATWAYSPPLDLTHPASPVCVLSPGELITCAIKLHWAYSHAVFLGQDYRYPRTHPDDHYNFTITHLEFRKVGTKWLLDIAITGVASQFSALVVESNVYGHPVAYHPFVGPGIETIELEAYFPDSFYHTMGFFAHPAIPPPTWGRWTWGVNNWQAVG